MSLWVVRGSVRWLPTPFVTATLSSPRRKLFLPTPNPRQTLKQTWMNPRWTLEVIRTWYGVDTELIRRWYGGEYTLSMCVNILQRSILHRRCRAYFSNTSQTTDIYLLTKWHTHHLIPAKLQIFPQNIFNKYAETPFFDIEIRHRHISSNSARVGLFCIILCPWKSLSRYDYNAFLSLVSLYLLTAFRNHWKNSRQQRWYVQFFCRMSRSPTMYHRK